MKEFATSRCDYIDSLLNRKNWKSEAGIVYVKTINETTYLADYLKSIGYKSDIYHGNLSPEQKERLLNKFMNSWPNHKFYLRQYHNNDFRVLLLVDYRR